MKELSMNVPLLDLKAQYATIKDEIKAAVDAVLESQYFIGGPAISELEQCIARYSEAAEGVGVGDG